MKLKIEETTMDRCVVGDLIMFKDDKGKIIIGTLVDASSHEGKNLELLESGKLVATGSFHSVVKLITNDE